MKIRITAFDFGRISPIAGVVYVIEHKRHWWSKWSIRDWDNKSFNIPRFYLSRKEAETHI